MWLYVTCISTGYGVKCVQIGKRYMHFLSKGYSTVPRKYYWPYRQKCLYKELMGVSCITGRWAYMKIHLLKSVCHVSNLLLFFTFCFSTCCINASEVCLTMFQNVCPGWTKLKLPFGAKNKRLFCKFLLDPMLLGLFYQHNYHLLGLLQSKEES